MNGTTDVPTHIRVIINPINDIKSSISQINAGLFLKKCINPNCLQFGNFFVNFLLCFLEFVIYTAIIIVPINPTQNIMPDR